jgi:hypothetical protein
MHGKPIVAARLDVLWPGKMEAVSACRIDGCPGTVIARGWCNAHYIRWRRFGDPLFPLRRPGHKIVREVAFWAKVNKDGPLSAHRPDLGPCWLWTAAHHRYGIFQPEKGNQLAHRIAYEMLVGPVPEGLELDHLCRVTLCVNPAHLEPVTHRENVRRGKSVALRL